VSFTGGRFNIKSTSRGHRQKPCKTKLSFCNHNNFYLFQTWNKKNEKLIKSFWYLCYNLNAGRYGWLTPCSRVFLEKVIVTQLVIKFHLLWTWKFITMFTRAHHWPPSLAWWTWSTPCHPISLWYILISSFYLCIDLQSDLFPSGFLTKCMNFPISLALMHATCPAHLILLCLITLLRYGEEYKLWRSLLWNFLHPPITSSLLGLNTSSASCSQTPSVHVLLLMWKLKFHIHRKQRYNYSFVYFTFYIFTWSTQSPI